MEDPFKLMWYVVHCEKLFQSFKSTNETTHYSNSLFRTKNKQRSKLKLSKALALTC